MIHESEVTCPACGVLLSGNTTLETLADLRYNSRDRAAYTCPRCGAALEIREEQRTVYSARQEEAP